jgi:tetratricopeptide (TPR) repeat protein
MSFRFFKRVNIAPGMHVNLSKSGGSLSFGPRGAAVTVGARGVRATAGIPGTGMYYTKQLPGRGRSRRAAGSRPQIPQRDRLTLGFFETVFASPDKLALVEGLKALTSGDESKALEHLREATEIADGAFLAGFLAAKEGNTAEAEGHLVKAAENLGDLGRQVMHFGIDAVIPYPITPEITANICMDRVGWMLLAAEVYQQDGMPDKALYCVAETLLHVPDDPVVRLSLAELLVETAEGGDGSCRAAGAVVRELAGKGAMDDDGSGIAVNELVCDLEAGSERVYRRVVKLAQDINNLSPIHSCLLLYRARALRGLGLSKAARQTLTNTLRRKKGRPEHLMRALRYERALAYAETGQRARSRGDLEMLYASDPDYEDVASRLGLA